MPEQWNCEQGHSFVFEIPEETLEGRFIPKKPDVERNPSILAAPCFAQMQIESLIRLSQTERASRLAELEERRKESAHKEVELQAERDRTMTGNRLYHMLLDMPEIMRNVLDHLDKIELVCFCLASKTCAKLAFYLLPDPENWDFEPEERMEVLMFLYEDGWFEDHTVDFCEKCEMMMPRSRDLGGWCDACCEDDSAGEETERQIEADWREYKRIGR